MDELKSIRSFVKVVEAGSFAEAARQEGIAKSVITKRINQLESHMEMVLLQRSTRKMSLTDTGANFYERCVKIVGDLDNAKSAVSTMEWGLSGTFRVSCISSFTSVCLAQDLCEFGRDHPDLSIDLQQHDRFCDPVHEGFDVCIQAGNTPTGVLEATEVLPVRRLLVASPSYLEKHGIPSSPEDLADHPFALNNYVTPTLKLNLMKDDRPVEIPIEPVIVANNIWMLHAAVTSGHCLSLMPIFFIEKEILSGKLVPIMAEYKVREVSLRAYYRRSQYVPMKVRIFINFLRRKYGDLPPRDLRVMEKMPELKLLPES